MRDRRIADVLFVMFFGILLLIGVIGISKGLNLVGNEAGFFIFGFWIILYIFFNLLIWE